MQIRAFEVDFSFRKFISAAEVLTGHAPFLRSVYLENIRGDRSDWMTIFADIDGIKTKKKSIRNLSVNDEAAASLHRKAIQMELVIPETLSPGIHHGTLHIIYGNDNEKAVRETTLSFDFEILSSSQIPTDFSHAAYLASWIPTQNTSLRSFSASIFSNSSNDSAFSCMSKIYYALLNRHLVYLRVPTSHYPDFQSFPGFDSVLSNGGSCADLSLLFASLLWQNGHSPALLHFGTHMTAGCFADKYTDIPGILDDTQKIMGLITSQKLRLIEITDLCSDKSSPFEHSVINAINKLQSSSSCCLITPLTLLRNGSVRAFPDAYHDQPMTCPHCGFNPIPPQTNAEQIICPACQKAFSFVYSSSKAPFPPAPVCYDPKAFRFGTTENGFGVTRCIDKTITSVQIPSKHQGQTVTCIGANAFSKCQLEGISFSEEITIIGDQAFRDCPNLTSIALPDNLTSIGSGAFSGSGLTSIRIPGHVSRIPALAFANCSNLETATLEEGIEIIDQHAFLHCPKLIQVFIPNSIKVIYKNSFDSTCQLFISSDNTKLIPY